jgi:hypothetical protein
VNQPQHTIDHEELAGLLPWYVNETLDETERKRVRRHIEQCAACRDDVDMLSEVRRAVRSGSPAPLVPQPDTERLHEALDENERPRVRRAWPWLATAATFTAVAVAVAWQLAPRPANPPAMFETLTSAGANQPINYVLEIRFTPNAPADSHGAFFESIGASNFVTPMSSGVYRVALGLGPVSLAELEQYARDVESRPEIAEARFVAVQLPVE